jgi:Flp pilus assembly protein TadG
MKRMRDESGQALIMVALCLTCIMGFVGFATDVGVLLHAKRNLQIAADAAALAGAN